MSKKTLILTKEQIDEICDGNYSYLDGLATKPDMASVFSTEVSSDGSVESGYADPTATDDYSGDMTNDWRGNAKLHGLGPITVREWKEKYLKQVGTIDEEQEHGNARLKNATFGAKNGEAGKSYDATKMALSRKRKAEEKMRNGSTPEEKRQGARTLSRMKNNWNGLDNAETQYNAAKAVDKTIQQNRPDGLKKSTSVNGLPKMNGGVFLNQ